MAETLTGALLQAVPDPNRPLWGTIRVTPMLRGQTHFTGTIVLVGTVNPLEAEIFAPVSLEVDRVVVDALGGDQSNPDLVDRELVDSVTVVLTFMGGGINVPLPALAAGEEVTLEASIGQLSLQRQMALVQGVASLAVAMVLVGAALPRVGRGG